MTEYLSVADELEPHDAARAREFRALATEAARVLVSREQRWLCRKIDPAAILAMLFLVVPAVGLALYARSWDSTGWKWVAILGAVIWALLWAGVGLSQMWNERDDDAAANGGYDQ